MVFRIFQEIVELQFYLNGAARIKNCKGDRKVMKIKVIGKAHREGVSKQSGNPYNFNQVHYNGPDRGVEGMAALTLNLDPSLLPYADIKIGGEYEVDFGPRGYVVSFTPTKF